MDDNNIQEESTEMGKETITEVDELMYALMIVEKEIGSDSMAAAQLLHRIGLEFCRAGDSDVAQGCCADALSIVQSHASSMLLGINCTDHLM